MGIVAEEGGVEEFRSKHIPGAANLEADYLSRPEDWPKRRCPEGLKEVKVVNHTTRVYRLPTPRANPKLWATDVAAKDAWACVRE